MDETKLGVFSDESPTLKVWKKVRTTEADVQTNL
jgi:hypothetical protein